MRAGITRALEVITTLARRPESLDDLCRVRPPRVAGREHADIADLVVQAARLIGRRHSSTLTIGWPSAWWPRKAPRAR